MTRVSAREFFRKPYQYLDRLPIVVTKRGKDWLVVTLAGVGKQTNPSACRADASASQVQILPPAPVQERIKETQDV